MSIDVPARLADAFAPLDSHDRECLGAFVRSVQELRASRFGHNLDKLGQRPKITRLVRRPGGGGSGLINVRSAAPEARAAVFAVVRRLRDEHEYGSLHQACGVLRGATKRRGTKPAIELGYRIEALRRGLRDARNRPAPVGASVTDAEGSRTYMNRNEIIELAEYGHHFHQGNAILRRDWLNLPTQLLEPSIDEALRVAAESAIAVYPLASAVLEDPALVRR